MGSNPTPSATDYNQAFSEIAKGLYRQSKAQGKGCLWDFMKLLKSVEELLYELVSCLPSVYDPTVALKAIGSGSNLPIARGVIFGIFPLCMSVTLLRSKTVRMTRKSLRALLQSVLCRCAVRIHNRAQSRLFQHSSDFFSIPQEQGNLAGLCTVVIATAWYGITKWLPYSLIA